MSRIYLVRHGQAGTRKAYDSLSELGKQQARLLGEYFLSEGVEFSAAFRGDMVRHEQTAAGVRQAYAAAGMPFPEIAVERRWNEFDLDGIYRALAPQLAAEDAEFQREYNEMVTQARAAAEDHTAGVHRRWMPSDAKVVAAWLRGRHTYEGESWDKFRERVADCRTGLEAHDRDANIVVFTSATPIGIWTALTMEIADDRAMRLAGVLHNASFSVIRLLDGQLRLHTFNAVPHLPVQARTYR